MTVFGTQIGVAEESTYGTPVTPATFFEYEEEDLRLQVGRLESNSHRAGSRVASSIGYEPYRIGAAGPVKMYVPTKKFGIMLKHALGSSSIGSVSDLNYTQTHTIGSLSSRYLTVQGNRPLQDGTDQAHTFHGSKITSFELSCSTLDALMATIEFDCEDEDTSTALASPSYASDFRKFSWAGASLTIGGSSIELTGIRVRVGNPLNTARHRLRTSTLKKNPLENGRRLIEWELTAVDHTALTQYNRFADADRADNLAAIVATFDGPIAHAGTTKPRLEVTIPVARFDAVDGLNVAGFDELAPTFSGVGLNNHSDEPITITYRTTDSAVV